MKINTEELEETIIPVKETDLIYGIDDRPRCLPLCSIY